MRLSLACVALLATGCSIGASMVRRNHGSYNDSIVTVLNEQLLLNLVRLRYRDNPYFLDVASVTTQQTLAGSAGIGADVGTSLDKLVFHPSLGMSYSQTPTVVFTPLQGEGFFKKLLAPLSLPALAYLCESGWSIARVLALVVDRMNDVQNASSASGPTPQVAPPFEQFHDVVGELRAMQQADTIGIGIDPADKLSVWLDLRDPGPRTDKVSRLLGLDPSLHRYSLTTDFATRDPSRVAVRTRSLLGVLFFLSQGVDVPAEHTRAGLVRVTTRNGAPFAWSDVFIGLFHVRTSDGEPDKAYVRVRYRDAWFYIADDDLDAKATFMLLTELFNVQAGNADGFTGPTLTLPLR